MPSHHSLRRHRAASTGGICSSKYCLPFHDALPCLGGPWGGGGYVVGVRGGGGKMNCFVSLESTVGVGGMGKEG